MKKEEWQIQKDMERHQRAYENRRGRKNPSAVPHKLARTSAFVPRDYNLNTDSDFERYYVVPSHSVVRVKGRELGTRHRDMLYALFRKDPRRVQLPDGDAYYEVVTTWRELIKLLNRTEHKNNLRIILDLCEDLQQVVIEVMKSTPDKFFDAQKAQELAGAGFAETIIRYIAWDGTGLDDTVKIHYGEWVREAFEKRHLVSLNAEIQFRLTSSYAKSFWPYIDSQPNHSFIDEQMLATLAGVDLWHDEERPRKKKLSAAKDKEKHSQPILVKASAKRAEFRRYCQKAFDDMVSVGGLELWNIEIIKTLRGKTRRYHYIHALPRQLELGLPAAEAHP